MNRCDFLGCDVSGHGGFTEADREAVEDIERLVAGDALHRSDDVPVRADDGPARRDLQP
jgi:hypothetical protein